MNTRLKQFIAAENITQAQFADNINVVRASVSHILAGRNKPGYEFIAGLMRYYPNLNIEWLMFGKGKMYKDYAEKPNQKQDETSTGVESSFGSLFNEETEDIDEILQESKPQTDSEQAIQTPSHASAVPSISLHEIKTLINASQKPVNQRKLIKITAFFDDGTFQELTTI
jgi:transcriptional regulator with XRE-family HTH domain